MKTLYIYLVAPLVLLLAFLFTPGSGYRDSMLVLATKQEAEAKAKAEVEAKETARKKEIEAKALADAQRRQAERDAEEKAREEKKENDYKEGMKNLRQSTVDMRKAADDLAAEIATLEKSLANLRTKKSSINEGAFDLAKQIEVAKGRRRVAEVELQRLLEMVSDRVGGSSFAIIPPASDEKSKKD